MGSSKARVVGPVAGSIAPQPCHIKPVHRIAKPVVEGQALLIHGEPVPY
jgi:hypothetical protein